MLDQAQITSAVRHILTALGTALAGTGVASYFTDSNINLAVIIVGAIVGVLGAIWGNRAATPVALAQQLVANPEVSNKQAGAAIAAGKPEEVKS